MSTGNQNPRTSGRGEVKNTTPPGKKPWSATFDQGAAAGGLALH